MIVKTRVFELSQGKYTNLSELAQAMGISISQIYRVREGKRNINQKFIVGAIKACPEYKFDDIFYFTFGATAQGQQKTMGRRQATTIHSNARATLVPS